MRIGIAVLALLLTACGAADTAPPEESGATPPGPTAPPTTGSPTGSRPPPTAPTTPPGEITVRGVVQQGVEPGCLVLTGSDQVYLLVGERARLEPGAEVQVRGTPEPGLMTTCQQGTPLRVAEVRPG
ncbi:hypothetical protein [Amycolatopsis cihanbeyliensis]|uniref:Uncharacterized protein n=1 Tax=Amycolatopsis cihanbeyliensis TaxID=1128664 RepID=A0A542DCT1_AMYCI|nr:hypothetical protein [Amycolatopsis cihanbeyliensis]TQJ00865.1 hypothetical protein FB471_0516 [Amycolatopsis cihanbeyliensis]